MSNRFQLYQTQKDDIVTLRYIVGDSAVTRDLDGADAIVLGNDSWREHWPETDRLLGKRSTTRIVVDVNGSLYGITLDQIAKVTRNNWVVAERQGYILVAYTYIRGLMTKEQRVKSIEAHTRDMQRRLRGRQRGDN